jgi:hypothetical protein
LEYLQLDGVPASLLFQYLALPLLLPALGLDFLSHGVEFGFNRCGLLFRLGQGLL